MGKQKNQGKQPCSLMDMLLFSSVSAITSNSKPCHKFWLEILGITSASFNNRANKHQLKAFLLTWKKKYNPSVHGGYCIQEALTEHFINSDKKILIQFSADSVNSPSEPSALE